MPSSGSSSIQDLRLRLNSVMKGAAGSSSSNGATSAAAPPANNNNNSNGLSSATTTYLSTSGSYVSNRPGLATAAATTGMNAAVGSSSHVSSLPTLTKPAAATTTDPAAAPPGEAEPSALVMLRERLARIKQGATNGS